MSTMVLSRRSCLAVLLMLALSVCYFQQVQGAKVLLYPAPLDSHYLYFSIVGKQLQQQGHDIYMVTTPLHPWIKKVPSYGIKLVLWKSTTPEAITFIMNPDTSRVIPMIRALIHSRESGIAFSQRTDKTPYYDWGTYCTNLYEDDGTMQKLKDHAFDLVIIDGMPLQRCETILPYYLGVPHVTITTFIEPWQARVPALPSFVAFTPGVSFPDKMDFRQRLENLWVHAKWIVMPNMRLLDDALVSKYVPEKPNKGMTYIAGQSLLWLYNTDPLLDGPTPLMPNIIQVGGLTTGPSKPMSADLEKFVQGAEKGVVVVSFGSLISVSNMPPEFSDVLVKTFSRLPEGIRVIWRNDIASKFNLSSNVMTLPWLPQNDLLGNKNVRLFITHCGSNGQFEALYHGVPMLGLPIFTDQRHNAKRLEFRGYGLSFDTASVTPDVLLSGINKILTTASFSENIKHASKIYKSRLSHPKELASFWINHVLKFGGDHLHSHALELPWYQYLMLDIFVFLAGVLVTFFYILIKLVKCIRPY